MFNNRIKTTALPERVYELVKLVSEKDISDSVAKEILEPQVLNSSTSYYGDFREAAIELKLIEKNDNNLSYVQDKSVIKSMSTMRKYCNTVLFVNDSTPFYKLTKCFINSDLKWINNSITDPETISYVSKEIRIIPDDMRGLRFWLSYLGFCYIHNIGNKVILLPNMYTALKDVVTDCKFEKNKEYTVTEFIDRIKKIMPVCVDGTYESMTINYAMSNALREMHDNKEIELEWKLDSKDVWHLFHSESHAFKSEITHVKYKGGAQ